LAQLEENIVRHGCQSPLIVWTETGILLDGHNRYAICTRLGLPFAVEHIELGNQDEALAWIEENQLGRRNLTPDQFAYFIGRKYERLRKQGARTDLTCDQNDQKLATAEQIGQEHGIGPATVRRAADYANNVDAIADALGDVARSEILAGQVDATRADIAAAAELLTKAGKLVFNSTDEAIRAGRKFRDIKAREFHHQREAINAEKAKAVPAVSDRYRLVHGSVELLLEEPACSVDIVITDPPYPQEYLPLFADLARGAAHVLKPGGLLLCMSGQSWLPLVFSQLEGKGLSYLWTLAYLTGGPAVKIFPRGARPFWKPILVYSKGPYQGEGYADVIRSEVDERLFHHWGQSESGMHGLMSRFVTCGQVVVDPFLGGGTTAVLALALGATFLGFDVDATAINATKARIGADLVLDGSVISDPEAAA
jgi:site-specific DNA-methyltransferase (adenine-specific)